MLHHEDTRIRTRGAALSVVVVLLSACDVAAPADAIAPIMPVARTAALAATVEKGEAVLNGGGTQFIDCLGEKLTFATSLPYRYHSTTAAGGATHFRWMFIPGAQSGTATGMTSGTKWTLERAISPEVDHFQSEGSMTFHWTANFLWRSEAGDALHLHSNIALAVSPSGELSVLRSDTRCQLR